MTATWRQKETLDPKAYKCGYCGQKVGADKGYYPDGISPNTVSVRICPMCGRPTFWENEIQTPGIPFGEDVGHLPEEIGDLYDEARRCTSAGAHTAAVLACRKILMHVGVERGAKEGAPFVAYIEHLAAKGYVPPDGRAWVDHIRQKGNEANHEIKLMGATDSEELLAFTEMLLKFIYEFPSRLPRPPASPAHIERAT